MAELPEARPVILLAVQAPILLVVLVGQGGPALAAPAAGDGDPLVTLSPSPPCPHHHPGGQPVPIHPTALWASCFPCFLPCCRATASVCHRPQGGSQWIQSCQHRLAVRGHAGTPGWTGQGTPGQGQAWGGRCQPPMDVPAWSRTHRGDVPAWSRTCQPGHSHASLVTDTQRGVPPWSRMCHPGHGQRDVPAWSRTHGGMCHPGHGHTTLAQRDMPAWSRTHGGMCHPGHGHATLEGATSWVLQTGCRSVQLQCGVQGGRRAALGL